MILVLGGGVAGLSAAWSLTQSLPGADITVLDASDRVGGKLRQATVAGQVVDVGAESMLAVRPEAVELIDQIGAAEQVVHPVTTAARVWTRGELRALPAGTLMGVPGRPTQTRGVLSDTEVARAEAEKPWGTGILADDVSVGDYVEARLGPAVVDRLVEPLLGGVYAGHARRLSLQACVPALFAAARRGDSLLETARAAAPPPPVEGRPRRPVFAGLTGGTGRLPGLLQAALSARGVEVRTGTIARELHRRPEGWRVVTGPAPAPQEIVAEAVVLALPPAPAARLLARHLPHAAAELSGIDTASMAVVTMALPRSSAELLTGSGFLVPPADGRTIKAATFTSRKWGWADRLDPELVFVRTSVGRQGEEADLQREDDELVRIARAELAQAVGGLVPDPVDAHVQRWGGGLPQYAVGHLDRVARVLDAVETLPGLELAGAAYQGVGIPATIASGTRAARLTTDHVRRRATERGH